MPAVLCEAVSYFLSVLQRQPSLLAVIFATEGSAKNILIFFVDSLTFLFFFVFYYFLILRYVLQFS